MPELAGGAEKINAKHIDAAYEMGDALAIRAVEQMAHYLGIWVFNAYMTFNIDCIVFSGGLLKMGDKRYKRILENFENTTPTVFRLSSTRRNWAPIPD